MKREKINKEKVYKEEYFDSGRRGAAAGERLREKLNKKFKKKMQGVGLDYVFSFGQYRGRTCRNVCELDAEYIRWYMMKKILDFQKEVIDYMVKCRRKQKEEREKQREKAQEKRKWERKKEERRQEDEQRQANERWKDFFSQNKKHSQYSGNNPYRNNSSNNSNSAVVKVVSPAAQWDHLPDKQKFGKILGITGGRITKQGIRELYKKRMLEYHPDKCDSMGEEIQKLSHEMTIRINEANDYFKKVFGI